MSEPERGPQERAPQVKAEIETEGERNRNNVVLLLFFLVIVGIGAWLVNALVDARKADECISQGRRNCAPIDVHAR
jgi:hypothetical protein